MDSNPVAEFLGIQTTTERKFTLTVNSECSIKHNRNTQSTECKFTRTVNSECSIKHNTNTQSTPHIKHI